MIITIRSQATSEERAQLMALLCRITGSQHPITTTKMGRREVIVLDDNRIDAQAQDALSQQSAIDRLTNVKTPYQLVSRVFQAESTNIVIGNAHTCNPVTIGGA